MAEAGRESVLKNHRHFVNCSYLNCHGAIFQVVSCSGASCCSLLRFHRCLCCYSQKSTRETASNFCLKQLEINKFNPTTESLAIVTKIPSCDEIIRDNPVILKEFAGVEPSKLQCFSDKKDSVYVSALPDPQSHCRDSQPESTPGRHEGTRDSERSKPQGAGQGEAKGEKSLPSRRPKPAQAKSKKF